MDFSFNEEPFEEVEYKSWWVHNPIKEKKQEKNWDSILTLLLSLSGAVWLAFIVFKLMH